MSWLDEIVKQHEEYESPRSFWYWSALATISATLKDNVYLDKFLYKLYPNIYVMLHADSGLKKGAPISMAKQLVTLVNNTHVISGRSSIQGILKKLGTAESLPGGKIKAYSTAFICSSELTSSIVEDKAATTILTDLYDRNYNVGDWESLLKMESFKLKNVTVVMLAGTNEAHSEDFFLRKEIQGGYVARTFVVYEKEPQTVNSLMFPPKVRLDYIASSEYLRELSRMKGEIQIADKDRHFFDAWYKDLRGSIKRAGHKDITGTLNRFDDSVLKVALLISLGTTPELTISHKALEEAIHECEKLIGNVRRTTMGAEAKHQWAQQKIELIYELLQRDNHSISRQQLLKKFWLVANSTEWDEILKSLIESGHITLTNPAGQVVYTMPPDRAEEWKTHLKGKI